MDATVFLIEKWQSGWMTEQLSHKPPPRIAPGHSRNMRKDAIACTGHSEELPAGQSKFIGDVDLPEGVYKVCPRFFPTLTLSSEQEPLLTESKRRFVLFPIQYHDVCFIIRLFVHDI